MMSLKDAGVDYSARRMILLGAGAAATSVAIQAVMEGVRSITIFNRRDDYFEDGVITAARLRDRFDCDVRILDLADLDALRTEIEAGDILINGTPIGMEDTADRMALPDTSFLHPDLVVCDLIYVPRETLLLKRAAQIGCRTVSGLGMQLFQAVPAFKLWTGKDMDVDVAREALFG
jgi:shikimate dehydrogenase